MKLADETHNSSLLSLTTDSGQINKVSADLSINYETMS